MKIGCGPFRCFALEHIEWYVSTILVMGRLIVRGGPIWRGRELAVCGGTCEYHCARAQKHSHIILVSSVSLSLAEYESSTRKRRCSWVSRSASLPADGDEWQSERENSLGISNVDLPLPCHVPLGHVTGFRASPVSSTCMLNLACDAIGAHSADMAARVAFIPCFTCVLIMPG